MSGKVVVNRSMSLDGFIAGPGDSMDWIFDFVAPDAAWLTETAAAVTSGEAVATALDAAGRKNLEILGADVAGQCLRRGLVDEILVSVLPVLLGDGIPFRK